MTTANEALHTGRKIHEQTAIIFFSPLSEHTVLD